MADADGRDPKDRTLGEGIRCDAAGCIARLADNSIIAIANSVEAFAEDCRRAAVVLSAHEAPPDCGALLIDRKVWKRTGAVALRRTGEGFDIAVARPPGYDRPWARAPEAAGEATAASRSGIQPSQPRDATPNVDDLEPGD
jgi:competence protein ComEC